MSTEKMFVPQSPGEALDLMEQYGYELLVVAGGTTAMPAVNQGLTWPRFAMTLHRAGLDGVRPVNGHVEIGATTRLTRVAQLAELPLLSEAAQNIGGWAVRNMATLAGNLFVPPPAGDAATALLALDAQVIAANKTGERCIPLDEFYTGLLQTVLAKNELVTRIDVPRARGETRFVKLGRRRANTPAVVTVAVQVVRDERGICTDARLALGAVHDHPFRAKEAESALVGRPLKPAVIAEAAELAKEECKPFSDALASDWYRRRMVGV
ncbi:MAG: FAD binding domain-containing protein, partial [Rudaea sp.]